MDPALRELLEQGAATDEVESIIRLAEEAAPAPPGVRIITRFGTVATCRLKRQDIPEVWSDEAVVSLKAPRPVSPDQTYTEFDDTVPRPHDQRRSSSLTPRGRGIVLGILDWG